MNRTPIAIVIALLIAAAVFSYERFYGSGNPAPPVVACTEEAKLCPDGSAVGRIGPNCEFAECPALPKTATVAGLNQRIFTEGIFITPLQVEEDSRCPADAVCVWAGAVKLLVKLERETEIQETVLTLGSPITFAGERVSLDAVSPAPRAGKTIAPEEYRFSFLVTESVALQEGTLKGKMTIGPICPVERADQKCNPTPEMFAARKVFVYGADRKTLIAALTPDGRGEFSINLPEGNYFVDMERQMVGFISGVPVEVKIEAGKVTDIEIRVDTGIR